MRMGSMAMMFLASAFAATRAEAGLINGDFETGDLSGWIASGNVSVSGSSPYPSGGAHHAAISSTAFGTPGRLSQTFSVTEPSILSFDFYSEVSSGPASIGYALTNLDSNSIFVFDVLTADPGESVEHLFDPPSFVPSINHLISVPGNYELFVVADAPSGGSSYGEIENVTLTAVPEPSSVALLLAAAGCFAARRYGLSWLRR